MGIREEREKYTSQFVSVRQLLVGLAEQESISIEEVAKFILKAFDEKTPPHFIRKVRDIQYEREEFKYSFQILNNVAFSDGFLEKSGQFDNLPVGLDYCGWFRIEMADFLSGIGIDPPACCSKSWISQFQSPERKVVNDERELKYSALVGASMPPTKLMLLAQEVQKQFWDTFDPEAPGAKRPTQNEIIHWLMAKKNLAEVEAKAVEKVACPLDRNPIKRS